MSNLCTNVRAAVYERVNTGGPGPGSYDARRVEVSSEHRLMPRCALGTASRTTAFVGPDYPGPGSHTDLSATSTITPRQAESRIRDVPAWAFPTSARPQPFGPGVSPGPGDYQVLRASAAVSHQSPRSVFPRSPRKTLDGGGGGPGPAEYGTLERSAAFGTQTTSDKVTSPRAVMPRAPRGREMTERLGPGPAAYGVDSLDSISGRPVTSMRPRSSTATIGRAARGNVLTGTTETPGPGMVDVSPLKPSTTLGSMGRSTRDGHSGAGVYSPGPGEHVQEDMTASSAHALSPRARIGNAARFDYKDRAGVPGVGSYAIQAGDSTRAKSPTWRFGSSGARPAVPGSGTPSPAEYQSSTSPRQDGGTGYAFPHSPRRTGAVAPDAASQPGPGSYSFSIDPLSTTTAMPRQAMGHATRGTVQAGGEGSGRYYTGHVDLGGTSQTNPASPRAAVGKAERFPLGQAALEPTPSPVDYGYTFRADAPKPQGWTIRAR